MRLRARSGGTKRHEGGFSLAELVMVCTLLLILAGVAMPVTKFTYTRSKEMELRSHLRSMRNAIDEYKRFSDAGLIEVEVGSDGYPENLELLVEGVEVVGQIDRTMRFLRQLRQVPFSAASPEGWPDEGAEWTGPDALMRRIELLREFARHKSRGVDARRIADMAFGPVAREATVRAIVRAPSRRDALTLALASSEFQRR